MLQPLLAATTVFICAIAFNVPISIEENQTVAIEFNTADKGLFHITLKGNQTNDVLNIAIHNGRWRIVDEKKRATEFSVSGMVTLSIWDNGNFWSVCDDQGRYQRDLTVKHIGASSVTEIVAGLIPEYIGVCGTCACRRKFGELVKQ